MQICISHFKNKEKRLHMYGGLVTEIWKKSDYPYSVIVNLTAVTEDFNAPYLQLVWMHSTLSMKFYFVEHISKQFMKLFTISIATYWNSGQTSSKQQHQNFRKFHCNVTLHHYVTKPICSLGKLF